jgi:hypothetical protein
VDYVANTTPMIIDIDNPVGACVYFEQILSNYMPIYSEVANTEPTSSGPETFLLATSDGTDPRSNVVINGVAQNTYSPPEGTWGWLVRFPAEGSGLFEHDLFVTAGQE